jgi:multimeric flavodoxin WrbA
MNILGIFGSMRANGNSDWMINRILDSAKNEGAHVERIFLRDLHIEYCKGCDACHENGGECVIEDDMQGIYPKLLEAHVIVVGCPNYFKNVSALMKNFVDRTNAFVRVKPRKLEGKYAIGLCVGGEELEDTQHCEDALSRFFRGHRMRILSMVKARADALGSISGNIELEKKLLEIGKKLAQEEVDDLISFR